MAEIVNLRTARKRKARAEKDRLAGENRTRSGQTATRRQMLEAERARAVATHEAHRRQTSAEEHEDGADS